MALAVTKGLVERRGKDIVRKYKLAFDSSYPTGGEALPASGIGDGWNGSKVRHVIIKPSGSYFFLYDKAADKIAAWTSGAEVANTTNLAALTSVEAEVVCVK